jgi:hypothetical protein
MMRGALAGIVLALCVAPGRAEPFCATTEPGVWPEDIGWERWTNDGGAQRWFEDGALVLDGMASIYIADMYKQYLPALPVIGEEILTVAWGLRVDEIDGFGDPGVEISIDGHGDVVLVYSSNRIYSLYECAWVADFVPGVLHNYVFTSLDLDTYLLLIDRVPVYSGLISPPMPDSYVAWGDGGQGAASRSTWAYVRVTVTRPGDANGDGVVNFGDINAFVALLIESIDGEDGDGCGAIAADVNQDGAVNFGDINPFVELLTR